MELRLQLTGNRPMLLNNVRLANPLDPYAQQISAIARKHATKKTDEDRQQLMWLEARGSCYENEEGLLGLPNENVWRSLYNAAKTFKRGEDVKRSLRFAPIVEPLLIDGAKVSCDDFLMADANARIDYRSAKPPGQGRVMRARPLIPTGWQSVHTFELDEAILDARDLTPILLRASTYEGLGNWRPTYGTYEAEVLP
jgi:hypothetical protein